MSSDPPQARPVIGVIGGLGPQSTVEFFDRLVRGTPAATDQDHLHVIIDCDPTLPNRNDAIAGRGPSPGPGLAAMARRLENAGADMVVMPCNTAHHFQPEIEGALARARFESIIDVSVGAVARVAGAGMGVGVLATEGCLLAGLYQRALADAGFDPVVPTEVENQLFMELIYRMKSGRIGDRERDEMRSLAAALTARGAAVLIAACTEIPLVLEKDDVRVPLVVSTDELVAQVIYLANHWS